MTAQRIGIAGCGPAGLAAALLLQRDGHAVTMFERFDAPRPVGSGLMLQPTGMAVLAALGLTEAILARGARIERLFGKAGDRVVLDVRYAALGGGRFGLGIHRAALFDVLHDAVQASAVRIDTARTVFGSRLVSPRHRVLLFDDGAVSDPFDLIVDAMGARSPLVPAGRPLAYGALWASLAWPGEGGLDGTTLEQRYRRASVMAGVLPTGTRATRAAPEASFFWSLRADRLDAWRAAGIATWKREAAQLWPETQPLLDQIDSPDRLSFARYAHRTLRSPAEPALFHLGDAWHSTSPQLGQGANMALLDAWALSLALRQGADPVAAEALRRRHVRLYQAMSLLLTPVYQSDGWVLPLLRDRLVGPLARLRPVMRLQAAMVAGLVGDPLRALGLG